MFAGVVPVKPARQESKHVMEVLSQNLGLTVTLKRQ